MPQIYDNLRKNTLAFGLKTSFENYQRLDIATGYINLSAWNEFADQIGQKPIPETLSGAGEPTPVVRILVGMVPRATGAEILERGQKELRGEKTKRRSSHEEQILHKRELINHLRAQLMSGVSSAERADALTTLKKQLANGRVQMKVYTQRPLHGKTYIMHDGVHPASTIGYIGSSNFTHAGLNDNLELNIDVLDQQASRHLAEWFNKLWDDKTSFSITTDIIELIEESWAEKQLTPYEVYLKVCYELSEDMREGAGYTLPKSLDDILLDYQKSAVKVLARRLIRRGGTMLGDVVGLGKTITAVATAVMVQNMYSYRTLVLCPPKLVKMWEEHLNAYEVNGKVVSYSMAHKVLPDLSRFRLVICDESHNLRNEETQVYEAIRRYVEENGSNVLLLTATPFNLSFRDVAAQLGLYIDEDEDLGISPVIALEKNPKLRDKVDGKITTLGAFKHSEEVEDWRRLMSDHLVRRTRSFVKRGAPTERQIMPDGRQVDRPYVLLSNGEKFYYPERFSQAISHDFAEDDPARLMESEQTLDEIKNLNLPRYRISDFDDPAQPHSLEDQQIVDDATSGRGNVAGFVRVGLYKRLSSSGEAFIRSLKRQLRRNEIWLYALERQLPLPTGSYSEKQLGGDIDMSDEYSSFYGSDYIDDSEENIQTNAQRYCNLRENAPKKLRWVNSTIFRPALAAQLQKDNETLRKMLARFGAWTYERDSKLQALKILIERDHPDEKVLVFTEYKDTAEYVARGLRELGVERVAAVSGTSENPVELARRFSPKSSRLPGQDEHEFDPETELNVLVATDVLSEGQNLQDSHVVVNYDLPWAIIRLIQRAGRVDRVGQESDVVNIYLISHENVEETLQLRSRIQRRLEDSAQAFGSDEVFFGGERERQILDDFYKGYLDDMEEEDPFADAVSEAWLVWSHLQEHNPQLAKKIEGLQDKLISTRQLRALDRNNRFVNYVSTESGLDVFIVDRLDAELGDYRPTLISASEALRLFEAEPTTPTVEVLDNQFELQNTLVRYAFEQDVTANGNLKGVRKRIHLRFNGRSNTRSILCSDPEADVALDQLFQYPLQAAAESELSKKMKYSDEDLLAEVKRLHAEGRLVLSSISDDHVRVVCSLGIAGPTY